MSGTPPSNGRQYAPGNSPNPPTSYTSPQPGSNDSVNPRSHVRELSGSRGRGPALANITASNMQSQQAGTTKSPRSQSSAARSPAGANCGLERRPSATTQSHYRQASRAHGNYHQSRNAMFLNSPATSPMSPDTPGSAPTVGLPDISSLTMLRRGDSLRHPSKSSAITLNGSTHSPTSTLAEDRDVVDMNNGTMPQKRLERTQTSKRPRGHSHHRSQSKHQQEQKTVGEYALHHLFQRFVVQADQKIDICISATPERTTLETVCGAGSDPELDQLISSLAHINRQKPKPLIDTMMWWRRAKGEELIKAKEILTDTQSSNPIQRGLPRRNTGASHSPYPDTDQAGSAVDSLNYTTSHALEESAHQAEQRSTASIYLLCRVLIEVYNQSDVTSLDPDLGAKVEGIIFSQLKNLEPESFASYPFRYSNWKIYSQLLGVMSSTNLRSVSQRFVTELGYFQQDLGVKGGTMTHIESRAEALITAMRHVHVKAKPEGSWKESCDFLYKLAECFVDSHGQNIKHAYCLVLEDLVMPIVANSGPQINTQKWKDFLNMVNQRVSQMMVKPKHWKEAFRLQTVVLCASPTEHFAALWHSTATSLQAKLKDRQSRECALQAICRLVWTYLTRVNEPSSAVIRKFDDVMKAILPSGKKSYLSNDPTFSEPIIEVIRIIGNRHQEYCFRNIIFPLINSELFAPGKDTKVEQLEPEKIVVGIKAFLRIMADLEKAEHGFPPFPRFNSGGLAMDSRTIPGVLHSSQSTGGLKSTLGLDDDQSSRPVDTSELSDTAKEFYGRFCEILGKITLICDNAFGGQAVLDEKLGGFIPKTPLTETFTFGRRDEHVGLAEQRQGFYELFHVAVQALPRCLSAHVQLKSLINLLCTGTAHVHSNIAASSTISLKSIARQALAQPVTIGFARFIFNFDARYSTMSDEGLLGPGHIENTLRLYVELLQIWIEEIKRKSKDAATETTPEGSSGSRSLQLDLTSVEALVEEVESHGIFFLCSQSRRVRSYAVKVLKLVTEFDTALGNERPRIIQILERDSQRVMDSNDEQLTVVERSRLQKGERRSMAPNTLIELCSSDVSYDATLWSKLFPNIIRRSFELCALAVTLGRDIVCARLMQMSVSIQRLAKSDTRGLPTAGLDHGPARTLNRLGSTSPDIIIEQWKLYLVMACTTMTYAGAQTQSQLDKTQHARKSSRGIQQGHDKVSSARHLFAEMIPLLKEAQSSIRDAIVIALGSININLYRTLLDSLQYAVTTCKEEAKQRIGTHQRTGSNPRRSPETDRLRTEVTQVYRLTARFLREPAVLQDEWVLRNLCTYTKDLMIFLNDAEIQNDWECQKLRRQYCGLLEELFDGINRTADPAQHMPFESRKSAFALMEDWCGYSPNQTRIDQREHNWQSVLEQSHDTREKTNMTAAMEIEKRKLKTAALSAMASLCAGPIRIKTERGDSLTFDIRRMLSWMHQIFSSPNEKNHAIGRRALYNLITHNRDFPYILDQCIERCYAADPPRSAPEQSRALESYFEAVTKVLTEQADYPVAFWRILGAVLFLLGNQKSGIRRKSARLLRLLEQRQQKNSKIQDFDISISDRTTAVYKLAQFEISKVLARQHTELAFFVFSQFSLHFKGIDPDGQRNMVAAILPWIQVIELQVDPNGGPTAQSYMVLANLLQITTKADGALHNEIQALWQALATGPHAGNVQLILDFVISLCLDRRDQNFVDYAKQIIVYLSSTPAGQKVVEFLLLQINSRNMVQKQREPTTLPPDNLGLPYVADLSEALPIGHKQSGFSLGQLSLIFLVDLMVSPTNLSPENVPLLLQVVIVLWDHYTLLVQDQAREMLVHLIHELIIRRIDDDSTTPNKNTIEMFVESIRQREPNVIWAYEDWNGKDEMDESNRVPPSMSYVAEKISDIFSIASPDIQTQWAKTCLNWATSCPVRHIACRSFQVFRCILTSLDRVMLSDILARLSNTIVDKLPDVQIFSLEILTTLRTIIEAIDREHLLSYPLLFWATCACLETVYEQEFSETLRILEKLLEKLNLSDPAVVNLLEKAKPDRWQGSFEGIAPLVYKGLKSDVSLEKSLSTLNKVVSLPDSDLAGTPTRLLFVTLANIPCFLHSFDELNRKTECTRSAQILSNVAESQEKPDLSKVLSAFANRRYTTSKEFLNQILSTLRRSFFPVWELKTLIFLIGLLTNRMHWYKVRTLELLLALIQDVDTRRTEIASLGPDLISPMLRLLQTQYCSQALEVMDHIMIMSETPMSKQHIRMSFVGSASRATRKEYDRTQSLYGIPEETGWSIPMPAVHTNNTRANMQAVYLAGIQADSEAEAIPTPEIEFHADEEHQGSYFPLERSDTLVSETPRTDSRAEGGMGDLLDKLDSLDDFFDDDLNTDNEASDRYSAATITPYSQDRDTSADIYDQQTAPILKMSLDRTGSVSSLHNDSGYYDRGSPTIRDLGIMTPTAFNPPAAMPSTGTAPPSRPTLHSRSVTSPANNLAKSSRSVNELLSDNEGDETFSEDERSTGYTGAGQRLLGSTTLRNAQTSIRKMAPGLEGKDYRQRGLLRAQSRSQRQAPGSPSVPKVPEAYLQQQGLRAPDNF